MRCPGCGRHAPDRIQRLQKEAAAKARGPSGARAGGNGAAGQGPTSNKRIAALEAEIRQLRAAAGQAEAPPPGPRIKLPSRSDAEVAAGKEVAELEDSLGKLRGCTHPGKDKQVEELQAVIAQCRGKAHATWHPLRHRLRLEQRVRDAKEASERAAAKHKELLQQQEELASRITELEAKATAQVAAFAARQAELDDFDRREKAPSQPEPLGAPAAPPSWQQYQQRIEHLCRTGLPAEEALRQAAAEAASLSGLRQGRAEELELGEQDPSSASSDVEFENDEEADALVDEFACNSDADATFTRSQLREILAKQKGRFRAAAGSGKRRRAAGAAAGSVRQPAFTKRG